MNSLQIKNFLTVVKCGSLSKAAEELNVSQPTLSKSISALERAGYQAVSPRVP
ncbi:MAG: LysR family transcriptional regulator [Lachnospiraceae bacterium]|nr:LysR family transcriptional regulator [Lachnospiraceae bacterium]